MNCLEVIILRSVLPGQLAEVRELVRRLAAEAATSGLNVRLLRNALVDSDLCVHLRWDTCADPPQKSVLGLELAQALRSHGLVYHTLWLQD